jgi:peroxiredoxin
MRDILQLILAAAFSAVTLAAASPAVGDTAPDFTLRSLAGGTVTLSEFVADGPAALVVLRGYPGYQCPICSRQVHEFIQQADGFKQIGARVLFIYPGPSDDLQSRAEEFVADKTFPGHFTMLIDPDYQFTNRYDLRWDAPRETAYPATFLLGSDGKIFYAKISDAHGGRTAAAEMIELLRGAK